MPKGTKQSDSHRNTSCSHKLFYSIFTSTLDFLTSSYEIRTSALVSGELALEWTHQSSTHICVIHLPLDFREV